jgi:hypothetical protein
MFQHILADLALTAKRRMPGLYGLLRDAAPTLIRNRMSDEVYRRNLGTLGDREQIFTKIYRTDWWGSPESKSGAGSQLVRTETFRRGFQAWLEENCIMSLLDAPCGDYNWMQHVDFPPRFQYVGADIVGELIASNRARFPAVEFRQMDIVSDPLPCVDAWLCRDALIHFPNASARAVLDRFVGSGIRYLLATTFPSVADNRDIEFGQYRPLNLQLAPFNMPPPEQILLDDDASRGRIIGIWSREAASRGWQWKGGEQSEPETL